MRGIFAIFLALPSSLRLILASPPLYESDGEDQFALTNACPDYAQYSRVRHSPYSEGPLALPFQRPAAPCRTFTSAAVEKVIEDLYPRFKDPDLAHIFRNAFPNTLDTTVRWHVDGINFHAPRSKLFRDHDKWQGAQSFIVTGDIDAEWLRDSTNQLAQYQSLAKSAPEISNLILGAINTQAEFVIESPYCNAFQPPSPSRLSPVQSGQDDSVHPAYEPSYVFECKYELDSLANFLSLSNQYHTSTGSTAFLTQRWYAALDTLLSVLDAQSQPTFDPETGRYRRNEYTFRRHAWTGTETLNLEGTGNPLANGTGLIRSAFRPSDDATIFGFFIPANAMISVELARCAAILKSAAADSSTPSLILNLANKILSRSESIKAGIYSHAIVNHPTFGQVFAFEIDGYGSHLLMDDANVPSLLSLPLLGFLPATDPIYLNTRRMLLSQASNPYYLSGTAFHGIGGPHIGLRNAWPMSLLVQAMTSDNETEIMECLESVKDVSLMGLVNESVDVERGANSVTRSWFAWANSVFAQTVLLLAAERPELVFKKGIGAYVVGRGFAD